MIKGHFRNAAGGLTIGLLVMASLSSPVHAMGYDSLTCGELWERRTEILHRGGLCFETEKEVKVYGNDKCTAKVEADLVLSDVDRRNVEMIKATEQRKGCQ